MTTGRGSLGAQAAREWSRARARAARQHHPDVGGDVDTYMRALEAVDIEFGVQDAGDSRVDVHLDPSGRARAARALVRVRRTVRSVLARVPKRWRPGKTYIDL